MRPTRVRSARRTQARSLTRQGRSRRHTHEPAPERPAAEPVPCLPKGPRSREEILAERCGALLWKDPIPAPSLSRYSGCRAVQTLGGGFHVNPRSLWKHQPHILLANDRTADGTSQFGEQGTERGFRRRWWPARPQRPCQLGARRGALAMRGQVSEQQPPLTARESFFYASSFDSSRESTTELNPCRLVRRQGFAKVTEIRVRHNFDVSNQRGTKCGK